MNPHQLARSETGAPPAVSEALHWILCMALDSDSSRHTIAPAILPGSRKCLMANCVVAASMSWNVVILVAVMLPVAGCLFCLAKMRRLTQERSELWVFTQRLLESQENERKRLAGELHGNLGQNLLIIKNRAELGLASGGSASVMADQLKAISEVCSVALDETRRTAHNLGPHHLEQLGLT